MDDDRWRRLSPLLDHALALPARERGEWLASLADRQPTIVRDLEALLAEADALDRAGYLEEGPLLPTEWGATLEGQVFGAYTLERPLGQGGMGSVWLAHRSDGRYEGKVAVKLLNAALVGRAAERRFRREGDVLARLSHPHITRLIDAGIAPTGQPYLVLEMVEGEPIDAYCDHHHVDVEGRLRMFLDVLAAVAHAHASLVVHRDIKPSNVLVDHAGSVKLLDFGIAKLIEDDEGSGDATLTREAGRALTPEFAAPEQLVGQPVTTATDVYALGVLLYILLVGGHPAGDPARSPAELIRSIVDAQPMPASDAATSARMLSCNALTANAACRRSTPERLKRRLRGDLDNIIAKALKKDPRERYASVTAFADDLRRHLADEPVGARPDSFGYRAAKFVRRKRIPVVLSSLAIVAILTGLAGTVLQALRAAEQRDFAVRQVARVEAVNDLTAFLLYGAGPTGKPFTADDLLARAERIVERSAPAATRTDLLVAIGRGYQSLEEGANERRLLSKAFELSRNDPEPAARARAACAWGRALSRQGDRAASDRAFADAFADLPDKSQYDFDRIGCLLDASSAARTIGDVATGVDRAEAAQQLIAQLEAPPKALEYRSADSLAEAYRSAGDLPKADAAFRLASEKLAALGREDTQQAGTLYNNWGVAFLQLGQPLRGEPLLKRAIEISETDGAQASVSPMLLANYASALSDVARYDEARRYVDRAVSQARATGEEVALNVALTQQVGIDLHGGDLAGAQRALDEVEPRLRRMLPPDHYAFASLASLHSLLAQARHEYPAARAAADLAVDRAQGHPASAFFMPRLLVRRSGLELEMGRAAEARADAERALRLEQPGASSGAPSSVYGATYLALGRALATQGRFHDAAGALESALAQLRATVGPDHPDARLAARLAASAAAGRLE